MTEERFGAYRVVETLGQGAVTTIYKAVQEPLGRVVAIKALKAQIAPTSSFGTQIEREAKVLAELAHPNIVLVVDQGRAAGGRPYLVLEHVDGPSLDALLAKKRRVALETALALAVQVASALEHAHAHGVVHRDVKPGNVLLAKSGVVKLVDFGIAQRTRGAQAESELAEGVTPSGRLTEEPLGDGFGTPAYMSPEQILGDFVDGRSDLFSLGVVLYQMLTGTRPWGSDAPDTTTGRRRSAPPSLRRDRPVPIRERAPELPRAVERLVTRLLEPVPAARYANAAVVRERLEAALRAETREPTVDIVRVALTEAGFAPRRARVSSAGLEEAPPTPPWPLRRVLAGFAGVLVLFLVAVLAVERSSSARPRARPAPRDGAAAVLQPSATEGGLRVVATPWAEVRVDGVLVETTPFARAIPLAPGKHWVQLSHPDTVPVEREIEVGEGQIVMLDVTMPVGLLDAGAEAP